MQEDDFTGLWAYGRAIGGCWEGRPHWDGEAVETAVWLLLRSEGYDEGGRRGAVGI